MAEEEVKPPEIKPKTCATCQHLRGKRYAPEYWREWQCFRSTKTGNVVSGLIEYELCSDVRANVSQCYITGAWYEEYVPPVRETSVDTNGLLSTPEEPTFDSAALEANRQAAKAAIEARKNSKRSGLAGIDPKTL